MKYTNEIIIEREIDRVIELFDDPTNMYEWMDGLISHELLTSEAGQEGSKMRLRFKMGKNEFEMTETVIERNLPEMFAGKYESDFSDTIVRNQFVKLPNDKTKMISETTVIPNKFVVRLMTWILPGSFRKQSMKYLQNFKDFAEKGKALKKRIHLISGPRNVSTALMYSFGNRQDCSVVDEAFYAYYLNQHPDIKHPGREDILQNQSNDYDTVLKDVIFADYNTPLVFFKNMAHHFDGADWSFMKKLDNVLLIRQPDKLIASFIHQINNPSLLDIGLELEYRILKYLQNESASFVVIDSDDILINPESYLRFLCEYLSIPFTKDMLTWRAGPKKEDGIWAPYWYANVHKSTSFGKPDNRKREVPKRLDSLLAKAWRYYNAIADYKLNMR